MSYLFPISSPPPGVSTENKISGCLSYTMLSKPTNPKSTPCRAPMPGRVVAYSANSLTIFCISPICNIMSLNSASWALALTRLCSG